MVDGLVYIMDNVGKSYEQEQCALCVNDVTIDVKTVSENKKNRQQNVDQRYEIK